MRCGVGQLEGIESWHVPTLTWLHIGYSVWYVVGALVICLLSTFFISSPLHVSHIRIHLLIPNGYTPMQSSIPALITDRHNHYPRSHIHKLLTLLSVYSPQSRDELKRAVDDCAQLPKADCVAKKGRLNRFW